MARSTDVPPEEVFVPTDTTSPEAQALIEAGATPNTVDVAELMQRIQAMQSRLDQLSAAQGIPADPIAALVQALKDHVQAQANAHPNHDFAELKAALDELPDSDALTPDHTELVKTTVDDGLETQLAGILSDLAYVRQLSRDLHRVILKGKVTAG